MPCPARRRGARPTGRPGGRRTSGRGRTRRRGRDGPSRSGPPWIRRGRRPPPRCGTPSAETSSVTPTTRVACRATASRDRPPAPDRRRAAGRGRPRPRATAPASGDRRRPRQQPVRGRHGRGKHGRRVHLGLAEARGPPPWTAAAVTVPDRRAAVGGVGGDDPAAHQDHQGHDAGGGQRSEAGDGPAPGGDPTRLRVQAVELDDTPVAAGRPRHAEAEGAGRHPAHVDGGGQAEGTAQSGHAEHRAVGLSEEHAADGQTPEGPRLAGRLAQGQGRGEGRARATTGPRARPARQPHEEGLDAMSTTAPARVKARANMSPGTNGRVRPAIRPTAGFGDGARRAATTGDRRPERPGPRSPTGGGRGRGRRRTPPPVGDGAPSRGDPVRVVRGHPEFRRPPRHVAVSGSGTGWIRGRWGEGGTGLRPRIHRAVRAGVLSSRRRTNGPGRPTAAADDGRDPTPR